MRVQDGNRWIDHVARITGEGVYLRQKGKRKEYGPVSWGSILLKGAYLAAAAGVEKDVKGAITIERGFGITRRKRVKRGLL